MKLIMSAILGSVLLSASFKAAANDLEKVEKSFCQEKLEKVISSAELLGRIKGARSLAKVKGIEYDGSDVIIDLSNQLSEDKIELTRSHCIRL